MAGADGGESLGARIRALRRSRGLSQATLGRPLSRSYISLIEHDHAIPSVRTLLAIAARLQVAPCDLLDLVGHEIKAEYTPGHGDDSTTLAGPT